ncbi:MAG TPA: GNAT family N-acyltransferase [Blastocatellia bacterium]|nr:GNAT family N-acyltransferase [Blastocatellia bacterium]
MRTIETLEAPLIRAGALEARLATSFAEIDAALRLRFEVFNLELQEGLRSSYEKGFDTDAYDAYCDHLIVRDLNLDRVVGTYRLLRQSQAERQIGFYSENEFDLGHLKRLPGELLELGRSCIAASHRSFATINLLWSAIGQYASRNRIRALFGCGSLHCSDLEEVQPIYSYLRAHHFAPERYRVRPLESCRMPVNEEAAEPDDSRLVLRKLSPILRGYLRAGAMVCGAPAYDAEFGTADVLVLLEMEGIEARYKHQYTAEAASLQ